MSPSKRDEHSWTIDGIEEGVARVEEDGARMITVPRYLLPPGAREGQILRVSRSEGKDGAALTITIAFDEQATAVAMRQSKETTSAAIKASSRIDPGGDVIL